MTDEITFEEFEELSKHFGYGDIKLKEGKIAFINLTCHKKEVQRILDLVKNDSKS